MADHFRRFARHPSVSLQQVMETLYENEDMAPEQVTLKQEEYARLYATVKDYWNSNKKYCYYASVMA